MRARNIKPGLFENELLGSAHPDYTLTFIGLWLIADRDGILEDRPARIKGKLFPYREVDIEASLRWLSQNNFIVRYEHDAVNLIFVCAFDKHQRPHNHEVGSKFKKPNVLKQQDMTNSVDSSVNLVRHVLPLVDQVLPLVGHVVPLVEHVGTCQPDSLIPDSLIPDTLIPDPLIPEGSITPYGRNTTKARARGARKHPGGGHKLLDAETSPNRLQDALIARDAIIGMTPDEDASGRQISANKSVLLDRLKTLLESRPDITPEMLVETWRLYLRTNPKYLKAPQYFFGSKNNQKSEYSANFEQYLLELQGLC